jgi:hypothetical protein
MLLVFFLLALCHANFPKITALKQSFIVFITAEFDLLLILENGVQDIHG